MATMPADYMIYGTAQQSTVPAFRECQNQSWWQDVAPNLSLKMLLFVRWRCEIAGTGVGRSVAWDYTTRNRI